ncbi:MAG: VapC toxin family PIN domain ribonuclease, partial [Bryobacteraceae bacterium]
AVERLQLPTATEVSRDQAVACGALIGRTSRLGLSLGDCLCLTAAASHGAAAMTADRQWKAMDGVQVGANAVRVELIR